jgi:hypothetical protein
MERNKFIAVENLVRLVGHMVINSHSVHSSCANLRQQKPMPGQQPNRQTLFFIEDAVRAWTFDISDGLELYERGMEFGQYVILVLQERAEIWDLYRDLSWVRDAFGHSFMRLQRGILTREESNSVEVEYHQAKSFLAGAVGQVLACAVKDYDKKGNEEDKTVVKQE